MLTAGRRRLRPEQVRAPAAKSFTLWLLGAWPAETADTRSVLHAQSPRLPACQTALECRRGREVEAGQAGSRAGLEGAQSQARPRSAARPGRSSLLGRTFLWRREGGPRRAYRPASFSCRCSARGTPGRPRRRPKVRQLGPRAQGASSLPRWPGLAPAPEPAATLQADLSGPRRPELAESGSHRPSRAEAAQARVRRARRRHSSCKTPPKVRGAPEAAALPPVPARAGPSPRGVPPGLGGGDRPPGVSGPRAHRVARPRPSTPNPAEGAGLGLELLGSSTAEPGARGSSSQERGLQRPQLRRRRGRERGPGVPPPPPAARGARPAPQPRPPARDPGSGGGEGKGAARAASPDPGGSLLTCPPPLGCFTIYLAPSKHPPRRPTCKTEPRRGYPGGGPGTPGPPCPNSPLPVSSSSQELGALLLRVSLHCTNTLFAKSPVHLLPRPWPRPGLGGLGVGWGSRDGVGRGLAALPGAPRRRRGLGSPARLPGERINQAIYLVGALASPGCLGPGRQSGTRRGLSDSAPGNGSASRGYLRAPPPPPARAPSLAPSLPARRPRPGRALTLGLQRPSPLRASRGGRRRAREWRAPRGPGPRGPPPSPRPGRAPGSGAGEPGGRLWLGRAPPGCGREAPGPGRAGPWRSSLRPRPRRCLPAPPARGLPGVDPPCPGSPAGECSAPPGPPGPARGVRQPELLRGRGGLRLRLRALTPTPAVRLWGNFVAHTRFVRAPALASQERWGGKCGHRPGPSPPVPRLTSEASSKPLPASSHRHTPVPAEGPAGDVYLPGSANAGGGGDRSRPSPEPGRSLQGRLLLPRGDHVRALPSPFSSTSPASPQQAGEKFEAHRCPRELGRRREQGAGRPEGGQGEPAEGRGPRPLFKVLLPSPRRHFSLEPE
ncbi:collagen alpha-1(I) chain-like [Meriones unguiculatus]|uniref:collagen alpha-1(I) chain-like n=1 Tax=Meriones unguiculatus TaxID=10047 RepID=UPI00293EA41D|nr:collagen alpha-1(I) chain-like [Meriones unguiculatus]